MNSGSLLVILLSVLSQRGRARGHFGEAHLGPLAPFPTALFNGPLAPSQLRYSMVRSLPSQLCPLLITSDPISGRGQTKTCLIWIRCAQTLGDLDSVREKRD